MNSHGLFCALGHTQEPQSGSYTLHSMLQYNMKSKWFLISLLSCRNPSPKVVALCLKPDISFLTVQLLLKAVHPSLFGFFFHPSGSFFLLNFSLIYKLHVSVLNWLPLSTYFYSHILFCLSCCTFVYCIVLCTILYVLAYCHTKQQLVWRQGICLFIRVFHIDT
jgi:hypothetical protein